MNFRNLGDLDLAGFATNVVTLLNGGNLSAIDNNVASDLHSAFGTLPATLEARTAAAAIAEDNRKSVVTQKNSTRREIIAILRQTRDMLLASNAPKDQWDKAGFDYPDNTPTRYLAQDPDELSAFGYSNGVNKIRFNGNNKPGRVVYEIWRRHGDTVAWYLHGTTKRQRFTDIPVVPGQYYEYKVRAVAATSVSNFSNPAVVYGAV